MISSLLALALLLPQDPGSEPPILRVGETLEGEITDGDPAIHTPTLDKGYTDAPVVGRSVLVEVDDPGTYTLELRSYFFDSYLVLRDESGAILAEDDDGLIGTHSRIVVELEPGIRSVDACALHGQRGAFELKLLRGRPAELSPLERAHAQRDDLERALAVVEAARGPEHPDTAAGLSHLGSLLEDQGDYAAARPYYERALAIYEKTLGPEDPDTATSLNNLAHLLYSQGDTAAARPYFERALAIYEKALGPEHPFTATSLNNLAGLLMDQGNTAAARPLYERALAIREQALGPEHPDTTASLNSLANLLYSQGDFASAQRYYERALAIVEKTRGPEHLDTATSINNLAVLLHDRGDYGAALPYCERALAILEKTRGPEHPDTARGLNNLANVLHSQGDYEAARPYYERALAIHETVLGPEHPDTSMSLNNLAVLLQQEGDYASAQPYLERALAICETVLGPEHPDTAAGLNNLAVLLKTQGDYAAARQDYERALAIVEKTRGPEHPDMASGLNNLAVVLMDQGDYASARPYYERALAILEKTRGPEHPDTATGLRNLARLLQDQGDYAAARPCYERALEIQEKVLGPRHRDTATSLNNLANLLYSQNSCAAARPYYERALAIYESVLGPEHPDTATSLNNLAVLFLSQGDYAAAQPYLERALAIREKTLGPEHPDTAQSLTNLANLLYSQDAYAAARPYYERALATYEKSLGPEHPDTAQAHSKLGAVLADLGCAVESRERDLSALRARVRNAEKNLWSLSERERLSFLGLGESALRASISESTRAATAETYELTLAWRGLVSRSLLASRAQLRASLPAAAAVAVERLNGAQAELSKRLYATEIPDRERHEREIRGLREQRNALEVEVQRLSGPSLALAPTLSDIEQGLAPSEAFLDFLAHPLYRPAEREGEKVVRRGDWSEGHLSAWIVRKDYALVHLDLGPAAEIEKAARAWLTSVVSDAPLVAARGIGGSAQAGAALEAAHKLTALLWKPLAAELAGVTRVFVRPDSFLGTLPLGTLPLGDGKYLIEEKDFVYVQAPEDVVGSPERSADPSLLAVGGVDFEQRAGTDEGSAPAAPLVASAFLTDELRGSLSGTWGRLSHTVDEARGIVGLFETSVVSGEHLLLTGDAPTEERLKRELPRHAFVHLATHGFFHPAGTVSLWDSAREAAEKDELRGLEQETRGLVGELPGLLSGLVCAGANEPAPAGRDDGLLTAEEVLWLDLSKVELVVLSACETALGERRAGEGMIGLRRAFGLAGAKTVVSSLWSVKDRSTSELMRSFYENLLLRGQGRSEALRNAQLAMLAANRASEGDALPSTWGPFVLSGEWR